MPRRFREGKDRGYAAETRVPVENSQADVMKLLRREKADQTFFGTDAGKAIVGFTAHGRQIRITVPIPDNEERVTRQKWRCLLLQLKAKFEAIRSGVSTFEMEFQPNVVLPNGKTVSELVSPLISAAYDSGTMPALGEWRR